MGRTKGSKNRVKGFKIIGEEEKVESKIVVKTTKEVIEEAKEVLKKFNVANLREGWVNLYKHEGEFGTEYYTGSDIYDTKQLAQGNAGKGCIKQCQVTWEV